MDKLPWKKALFFSPHTDDAEFGAGGLIARLVEQGDCEVNVFAFSDCGGSIPPWMGQNILVEEFKASMKVLGVSLSSVGNNCVRTFPEQRQDILERMIRMKGFIKPDLVVCPSRWDIHQDHGVIHREAKRAFKNCTVLGYDIPWNCVGFAGACFIEHSEAHHAAKLAALSCYSSQKTLGRSYADEGVINGLAQMAATQAGVDYAERFEVIRLMVLGEVASVHKELDAQKLRKELDG